MQVLLKGFPEVSAIPGEKFRYLVQSSTPNDGPYVVDLEARFPATRCACPDYSCRKWPEFKKTLTAAYCKHSVAALVFHALRNVLETSHQLKNNHGE